MIYLYKANVIAKIPLQIHFSLVRGRVMNCNQGGVEYHHGRNELWGFWVEICGFLVS